MRILVSLVFLFVLPVSVYAGSLDPIPNDVITDIVEHSSQLDYAQQGSFGASTELFESISSTDAAPQVEPKIPSIDSLDRKAPGWIYAFPTRQQIQFIRFDFDSGNDWHIASEDQAFTGF